MRTDCDCDKVHFNAYVDGFNLYKGVLERNPQYKWLNLISFCKSQRPDMCLSQVFYFTANVRARFHGDKAPDRQHAYLRVLTNQGICVVRGKFRSDSKWLRVTTTVRSKVIEPRLPSKLGLVQSALNSSRKSARPDSPKANVWDSKEKGSDVNLASYLMRDVFKLELRAALVITGDSDLITPIRFCVAEGADVHVVVPNKKQPASALRAAATSLRELHPSLLANHQLPRSFATLNGGNIIRPESWG
jgi:uncharacterized LabA/DUF88 family protein